MPCTGPPIWSQLLLIWNDLFTGRLQVLQGRLRTGAHTYEQAMQVTPGRERLQTLVNSADYYFGMGDLLREWNKLDEAEQHLTQGMDLARGTLTVYAEIVTLGYTALARLQQARGNFQGALATLSAFAELADQRHFVPRLLAWAAAVQAELELAHGNLEAAVRWVEEFLASGRPCESGLLFIGAPGVGKTHLAAAVLAELIRRYRVRGRFVDFSSLLYQIQSTFDAGSSETKQSVLDPVLTAEVLVIDELGAQKPSPWVSEVLYLILNGRYTRRLTTLFTTNYYLESEAQRGNPLDRGAAAAAPDLLTSRIPAMLVSRLWEMARPVVIASDDYRHIVKSHQHR